MTDTASFLQQSGSLPDLLERAFWAHGDKPFFCVRTGPRSTARASFREVGRWTRSLARALRAEAGADGPAMVGLCARNRPEWLLVDFAAALAGLRVVGLHVPWPDADIEFVLRDARVEILVVERWLVPRFADLLARLHADPAGGGCSVRSVLVVDDPLPVFPSDPRDGEAAAASPSAPDVAPGWPASVAVTSLLARAGIRLAYTPDPDLAAISRPSAEDPAEDPAAPLPPIVDTIAARFLAQARVEDEGAEPDEPLPPADLAGPRTEKELSTELFTLIYTSGTSGTPKGVVTTQKRWILDARSAGVWSGQGEEDVVVSHMALAHGADRGLCWQALVKGARLCFGHQDSHERLLDDLTLFRPSFLLGLSHFWVRLYNDFWVELERRVRPDAIALCAALPSLVLAPVSAPADDATDEATVCVVPGTSNPRALPDSRLTTALRMDESVQSSVRTADSLWGSSGWLTAPWPSVAPWRRLVAQVARQTGAWDALVAETRQQMGGRLFWGFTGGAVTATEVKEWMRTVLFEGEQKVKDSYGATEFPGITTNGEINASVDLELVPVSHLGMAGDADEPVAQGEIRVRNPNPGVTAGYWNNGPATESAWRGGDGDVDALVARVRELHVAGVPLDRCDLDPTLFSDFGDPWYYTGDVGSIREDSLEWLLADVRQRGALVIRDRAKNLVELYVQGRSVWVNADVLAQRLVATIPALQQCFLYGDRNQDCLLVVVVPSRAWVEAWIRSRTASSSPSPLGSFEEACASRELHAALFSSVVTAMGAIAQPHERVGGLLVETVEWTAESGFLTVTNKPKRAVLADKYRMSLERLYASLEAETSGEAPAEVASLGASAVSSTSSSASVSPTPSAVSEACLMSVCACLESAWESRRWHTTDTKGLADFLDFEFSRPPGADPATLEAISEMQAMIDELKEHVRNIRRLGKQWEALISRLQQLAEETPNRVIREIQRARVDPILLELEELAVRPPSPETIAAFAAVLARFRRECARCRLAGIESRRAAAELVRTGRTPFEDFTKTEYGVTLRRCLLLSERVRVRVPYAIWANGWWRAPGAPRPANATDETPPELRQSLGEAKVYDQLTGVCLERDIRDVGVRRWKFLDDASVAQSPETFRALRSLWAAADSLARGATAASAITPSSELMSRIREIRAHLFALDPWKNDPREGLEARWVVEHAHQFHLRDSVDFTPTLDPETGQPLADPETGRVLNRDTPGSAILRALEQFAARPLLGMPNAAVIAPERVFAADILESRGEPYSSPRGSGALRGWSLPLLSAAGLAPARHLDGFRWLTGRQVLDLARRVARSLRLLPGVRVGDVVLIAGYNNVEWAVVDFACALAGLRPVGIHLSNDVDTALHVLRSSEARVLVTTSDIVLGHPDCALWTVNAIASQRERVPNLAHVVVVDAEASPAASLGLALGSVDALLAGDVPPPSALASEAPLVLWSMLDFVSQAKVDAMCARVTLPTSEELGSDDRSAMFSLLFTSGSTGAPKAAVLTVAGFHMDIAGERMWLQPLVTPSFIPLSHSSDRLKVWKWMLNGGRVGFCFYDASHWRDHETGKKEDMVRSALVDAPAAAAGGGGSERADDSEGLEASAKALHRHHGVLSLFAQVRELRPTAMACPPILWSGLFSLYMESVRRRFLRAVREGLPLAVHQEQKLRVLLGTIRRNARCEVAAWLGDRMESIITGGGPTPRVVQRFARSLAPRATFADSYGATEAGSITRQGVPVRVGYAGDRATVEIRLAPIPELGWGSAADSVAGVRFSDVEAWDDGAVGRVGELWVRSPQVCAGYWNDPERTAKAFVDGWYRTGDVAERFRPYRFRLLGRTAAAHRLGPRRLLFPGALEALFETSSLVHQVLVEASADESRAIALVVPDGAAAHNSSAHFAAEFRRLLELEGLNPALHTPEEIHVLRPQDRWTQADGLLSGELKKNRAKILARHADLLRA